MEIKSKFNLNDKVYFFDNNNVGENLVCGHIEKISIGITKDDNRLNIDTGYFVNIHQYNELPRWVDEDKLFASKNELINYITTKLNRMK